MDQSKMLATQEVEPPRFAVSLSEGPQSVLAMLPPKVAELVDHAMFTNPELFNKSEIDLYRELKSSGLGPTASDNRLRMRFWLEYDRARLAGDKKVAIDTVLAGVTSREYFYGHYLKKPAKLAWMLSIPTGYKTKVEEALEFGIDRMRDILGLGPDEIATKYGAKAVPTMLKLQQSIVDMMHSWLRGAPVQRSLAVNVNTAQKAADASQDLSMEQLEKKMKELEARSKAARNMPIDVTAEDIANG